MDKQLITNRLREQLSLLTEESIDVPYAAPKWQRASRELYENLVSREPFTFCNWPIVRQHFISGPEREKAPRAWLEDRDDWDGCLRLTLAETYGDILKAFNSDFARATITEQLELFTRFVGIAEWEGVPAPTAILEYGGGFGALRHLLFRHGYYGHYVICDLPVVGALQSFYLDAVGVEGTDLVPPSALSAIRFTAKTSSFISLWALSEVPLSKRRKILNKVKSFSSIFIVYQKTWEGIDNETFFDKWTAKMTGLDWTKFAVDANSVAIVGIRKDEPMVEPEPESEPELVIEPVEVEEAEAEIETEPVVEAPVDEPDLRTPEEPEDITNTVVDAQEEAETEVEPEVSGSESNSE